MKKATASLSEIKNNILDLFLTTNHTLVNSVNIIPGLSDHDIIEGVVDIKPVSTKKVPKKYISIGKRTVVLLNTYERLL